MMVADKSNTDCFLAPDNIFQDKHAFTVDVEEWFQVGAFETTLDKKSWPNLESRVVYQTERLLDLLGELSISGTFFCLGWVAERFPSLMRKIHEHGHEVGCHGSEHGRLFSMDRGSIEEDISRSKDTLENAIGGAVKGYRAPSFSLTTDVWWVYEYLASVGFSYSSSLYPVSTDHYGMANAPRHPFYPIKGSEILEIPMTVCDLPMRRLPASGGGYFRLMPYGLSRYLLRKGSNQSDAPGIFYMHPWEMDLGQPFVKEAPWLSRFRHYQGQAKLPAKLKKLASDFKWAPMRDVYKHILKG